jgi:hypothetical protein
MVEKTVWRKVQANELRSTHLLPQRVKSCSVSGFALLSILERNHARSAFKRLFRPLAFTTHKKIISLGQSCVFSNHLPWLLSLSSSRKKMLRRSLFLDGAISL